MIEDLKELLFLGALGVAALAFAAVAFLFVEAAWSVL